MPVAHPQDVMVIATMTAAEAMEVVDVMITVESAAMMIAVAMVAEIVTTMLPEESIAMPVTTGTAAVVEMIDVEVVEATLIAMIEEVIVALLARLHLPQPMVIQLLAERLGNHMEVDATMMTNSSSVNIDCMLTPTGGERPAR